MRLERIWAQQAKDKQVADALAMFAAMQTGLHSEKAEKKAGPSKTESKTSVTGLNSGEVAVLVGKGGTDDGHSSEKAKGRKMSGTAGINSGKADKKVVGRKMSGTTTTGLNNKKVERKTASGTRAVRKSQPINC